MSILNKQCIINRAKVVKKDNLKAQKEQKMLNREIKFVKNTLQKMYIQTGETQFVLNRCETDIKFNWEFALQELANAGEIEFSYTRNHYTIDFSKELGENIG